MDRVCIYLRKSRSDEEAERHGEGETLAKHKAALLKVAKEKNLNIIKIHEEIVSGESVIHRPAMLELLKEVEQGLYNAVLCMDIDRLGRGDMKDQGLILETFKESGTKIITPRKVYDLADEFDEEYSEFEAFMARKELKLINRRLQRGRTMSVEKGNYIATLPPYGYEIHYTDGMRTLKPHPEQAKVVKLIFDLYANKGIGCGKIANELNSLGYRTYSDKEWRSYSVLTIIKNHVYIGKVCWKKRLHKKSKDSSQQRLVKLQPMDNWIIADGRHPALISEDLFYRAQETLNKRYHVPYQIANGIQNPLAGLIKCQQCGASMIMRPYKNKDAMLMCYFHCGNKSSKLKYIEQRVIEGLQQWLYSYKAQWLTYSNEDNPSENNMSVYQLNLANLKKELQELYKQKENLHDLLERNIYDVETFVKRSESIAQRIEQTTASIDKCKNQLQQQQEHHQAKNQIIPDVEHVLDIYYKTKDPAKKNALLKGIIDYAEYFKDKSQRNDQFELILYPKLPRNMDNSQ